MHRNVGKADRAVRIVLGAGMIAAGLYYQSWWGAVGAVPLVTAMLGWCPAYLPFGISSCKSPT
ncbi:MAG: DUF2892 domain-containing protein [Xanthomonadales bacterium]|nr:DUF2892 domain-containing protein [Xanthomonadales bacterium]